jgi:hypothetical protein
MVLKPLSVSHLVLIFGLNLHPSVPENNGASPLEGLTTPRHGSILREQRIPWRFVLNFGEYTDWRKCLSRQK